jgi:hypothetical protein
VSDPTPTSALIQSYQKAYPTIAAQLSNEQMALLVQYDPYIFQSAMMTGDPGGRAGNITAAVAQIKAGLAAAEKEKAFQTIMANAAIASQAPGMGGSSGSFVAEDGKTYYVYYDNQGGGGFVTASPYVTTTGPSVGTPSEAILGTMADGTVSWNSDYAARNPKLAPVASVTPVAPVIPAAPRLAYGDVASRPTAPQTATTTASNPLVASVINQVVSEMAAKDTSGTAVMATNTLPGYRPIKLRPRSR